MLMAVYCLFFLILLARLWYIQVLMERHYKAAAQENRVRLVLLKATRGTIYDRNGSVLAFNLPSYGLSFVPASLKGRYSSVEDFLKELSGELKIPYDELCRNYKRRFYSTYWPVLVIDGLPLTQVIDIREWLMPQGVLNLEVDTRRFYPWGEIFSHVIGYTAEISEAELKLYSGKGYRGGDHIGKTGLEKLYEDYLRGVDGYQEIEVDALGRRVSVIKEVLPKNGFNLLLNIDKHLQKVAYDALGDRRGAVILMNPKNGAVLALVSKPSYDPNYFVWGVSPSEWKSFISDPLRPMYNRAVQAELPPGSLFKTLVALASLSEKIVSPKQQFYCSGFMKVGNRVFKCWKEGGHGFVNLYRAIAHSCNVYFYNLGIQLGVRKIAEYAENCGFGRKTGIDLPSESEGFVPTPEWKEKYFKEFWYPGDTVNLSIGQGFLLVTPIQMATFVSAIANGGMLYQPMLAKALTDGDGNVIKEFSPKSCGKLPFSKSIIEEVKKGMRLAVTEGTAKLLSDSFIRAAGKTGSAQNPSGQEHAWFMGFAPYDNPEIAIVVLIEEGGAGGSAAVPVAKKVLEFFFGRYAYGSNKGKGG
ncbi:MAG: penicillin-binding protein 2 [Synergistetes bacterium]|nr:penicillin-binding protein 2 [Synergistota bacterium]MDK2871261.1 penicillin-binding protein 2 [bacterium]